MNGVAVIGRGDPQPGRRGSPHEAAGSNFSLDMLEIEVNASLNGTPTSFHLRNVSQGFTNAGISSFSQFAQRLNTLMFSNIDPATGMSVTVTINMSGTLAGQLPVASMTQSSANTKYECTCASCTSVSFVSTASDPDNDLQSLAWVEDSALLSADGTAAPPELDLSVPMNFANAFDPKTNTHTVALVATDTRGGMSMATQTFTVQDTTKPVVTAPPNITLKSCDFPYIGQATATDSCDPNVVITSNQTAFQIGTNVVTWSAEDSSGNVGTATQIVTVQQADPKTCCPAGYPIRDGRTMAPDGHGVTQVIGTTASECLIGTSNNDNIVGNGGNDVVFGIGGQDQITTGSGADIIIAGNGTNDTIKSGDGNDKIAGGATNNTITAGNGDNIIVGGPNIDTITVGNGKNIIYALAGGDTISAGSGINYIDGGPDDDHITCGGGNNTVVGGFGNDTITVGGGTNVLAAWQGDDRLNGGTGTDTFLGGPGHTICTSGGVTATNTFVDCQTIK